MLGSSWASAGDGQGSDGANEFLLDLKRRITRWFPLGKSAAGGDTKINEMANVIAFYRGNIEAEDDDSKKTLLDSGAFDMVMSIVILLNTIVIGLEVDYSDHVQREWYWIIMEALFCLIFIFEITFNFYYHGWRWTFQNRWNFVTVVVAVLSLVDAGILNPTGDSGRLRMLSLFRAVGLVRMVRFIRRHKVLEELRLVIQGLQDSFQVLVWTCILTAVFIYICAILLTKQIGQNTEVYGDYKKLSGGWDHEELFGTVGRSMYTLLQAMTLDGWASKIARHTIVNQWYMVFFWILFLLTATFGIMNIVVSVIVELMLAASANNEKRARLREEKARKFELEKLQQIFIMSDDDGSGKLDLAEFMAAVKNPEIQFRMRQLDLPLSDAAKLFGAIDEDGSRTLTYKEFIAGCMKLKGPAQSKELLAIQAHADALAARMDRMAASLADSERMMSALDEVTARMSKRFDSALVSSRRKIAHSIGGSQPMQPLPRKRRGFEQPPLSIGNRPALPPFPDLPR